MSRIPKGAVAFVTAEQASYAAFAKDAIRRCWRAAGFVPPGLEAWLAEMTAITLEAKIPPAISDVGSEVDECVSEVAGSVLTVAQVAERIGRTDRRVVQLLESGRLAGQKQGRGRGTWVIDEGSVEAYQAEGNNDRKAG